MHPIFPIQSTFLHHSPRFHLTQISQHANLSHTDFTDFTDKNHPTRLSHTDLTDSTDKITRRLPPQKKSVKSVKSVRNPNHHADYRRKKICEICEKSKKSVRTYHTPQQRKSVRNYPRLWISQAVFLEHFEVLALEADGVERLRLVVVVEIIPLRCAEMRRTH